MALFVYKPTCLPRSCGTVLKRFDTPPNFHIMATTRLGTSQRPPDGGYGWVIVVGGFIVFTIVGGLAFSFGVLFVALFEAFHGSKADTGKYMKPSTISSICSCTAQELFSVCV